MIRRRIIILICAAMALALGACDVEERPAATSGDSPPSGANAESPRVAAVSREETEEANFRFLISDEQNAIGDFANLWVDIDRIGLEQKGGSWHELDIEEANRRVDLVLLQGDNAQEVLQAQIPTGLYDKVFIHVG